ncbi:MAG: class I mannose-6-phosphate isomerase [Kiritimatiellia bacterium]|jgi:mannose-6-phosphate isomerase|nr:class I mannose-6-phosphate isomerase [Kiritimatiellia bacterium]
MNPPLSPLVFQPVYQCSLWGGNRFRTLYHRTGVPAVCAESWEISAHPDGMSAVSDGPFAGQTLAELTSRYGVALTGTRAPDPARFPLLFKLLDASDRLSVQVHPNEACAARAGGEPKTEAWIVLDCAPGALLYAGLKPRVTPKTLRAALADGTVTEQLLSFEPRPGQALFLPGGLAHAIGEGCLIYEVQQNANTTYRLFDWNRTGPDGQARPLQIDRGLAAIDWSLPPPQLITPQPPSATGAALDGPAILSCPAFSMRRLDLREPLRVEPDGTSFLAFFAAAGCVTVAAAEERHHPITLVPGASLLLPAAATAQTFTPRPEATLYVTTL